MGQNRSLPRKRKKRRRIRRNNCDLVDLPTFSFFLNVRMN